MVKVFGRLLLLYFLSVSLFEIHASSKQESSYLKEGFVLGFSGHRLNYTLTLKKNYLQFKEGGSDSGFYVRTCNKRIMDSLEFFLRERLGKFYRENHLAKTYLQARPGESTPTGLLKVNDSQYPLYKSKALQPSAYRLVSGIKEHVKKGRKLCAPKS